MVKELHSIRVYYDVMVVTDQCSGFPINVAQDNLPNIIENETPKYEYLGSIHSLNQSDPWYSAIPYGDSDGKPCIFNIYNPQNPMKLNVQLSDNFQDNLNTVSELTKEDVSSDFFQTPFFRRWFVSQDLTELVPFYLVSNYISNINFLNKVWSEIPFDIFQNHQDILMKFELYSTPDSAWNWMRDSMTYQSYLHMISHFYGEEGFQRTLEIYNDTVNQLNKLIARRENEMEKITKPKRWRLQEFHDHMSQLYLEATTENRPHPVEFIPVPFEKDVWKVYQPSCSMDLAMWGRRVRNCVMSYEDEIFGKQSAIVLIEENEKPTYTAELDYKSLQEGRIHFKQLVGLNNRSSDLDEEKRNIVSNLIESALQK